MCACHWDSLLTGRLCCAVDSTPHADSSTYKTPKEERERERERQRKGGHILGADQNSVGRMKRNRALLERDDETLVAGPDANGAKACDSSASLTQGLSIDGMPHTTHLLDLSDEALLLVIDYLDSVRDVGACAMTSRRMAAVCDDRGTWRRIYLAERKHSLLRQTRAVDSALSAIPLCKGFRWERVVRRWGHDGLAAYVAKELERVFSHPWFVKADERLSALFGHPRAVCAVMTRTRASIVHPLPTAPGLPTRSNVYFVGTDVRFWPREYGHATFYVRRGTFDADGMLCGHGIHWHIDGVPGTHRPGVKGIVGTWSRGVIDPGPALALLDGSVDEHYDGGWGAKGRCGYGETAMANNPNHIASAAMWRDDRAHGPCSYAHDETLTTHAVYENGKPVGPMAWFADGRLQYYIPDASAVGTNPTSLFPGGRLVRETVCIRYSASGATASVADHYTVVPLYAHVWPNGDLALGQIAGDVCRVALFRISLRAPDARFAGRLLSFHPGWTLAPDPTTGVDGIQPPKGACLPDMLADYVASGMAGWCAMPDAGHARRTIHPHDTPWPCGTPPIDRFHDGDMSLRIDDFAHLVSLIPGGRVGVDEDDNEDDSDKRDIEPMDDAQTRASADLLALFACSHRAKTTSVCGARVRDAVCMWPTFHPPGEYARAPFRDLDLSGSFLQRVVLVQVLMEGFDFRGARLDRCVFCRCWFGQCAFEGAVVALSRFVDCVFRTDGEKPDRCQWPTETVSDADAKTVLALHGATIVD